MWSDIAPEPSRKMAFSSEFSGLFCSGVEHTSCSACSRGAYPEFDHCSARLRTIFFWLGNVRVFANNVYNAATLLKLPGQVTRASIGPEGIRANLFRLNFNEQEGQFSLVSLLES